MKCRMAFRRIIVLYFIYHCSSRVVAWVKQSPCKVEIASSAVLRTDLLAMTIVYLSLRALSAAKGVAISRQHTSDSLLQ